MTPVKQPRGYDCVAQDWIDTCVYGLDRKYNDQGHYGRRFYFNEWSKTLFSYGQHFPVGQVLTTKKGEPRAIWLNGDVWGGSRSPTPEHQSLARAAAARTSLPTVIIPQSVLAAARIDQSSIKILEVTPDRTITQYHERKSRPGVEWFEGAQLYEEVEYTDEEKERWHLWDQHKRRSEKLDEILLKRGWAWQSAEKGKVADNLRGDTPYDQRCMWMRQHDDGLLDLDIPLPEPMMYSCPTTYHVPSGKFTGWAHVSKRKYVKTYTNQKSTLLTRYPGKECPPDDDGKWRWETQLHVLGESLISADVHTTRMGTCQSCQGKGWREFWPRFRENPYHGAGPQRMRKLPVPMVCSPSRLKFDGWTHEEYTIMGFYPQRREEYNCSKCGGKGRARYPAKRRNVKFLSGFDHNEPRLAYFFCELPKCDATTVEEAYESLKPDAVILAEAMGRKVFRQGDIFAIETSMSDEGVERRTRIAAKRTDLYANAPTRLMKKFAKKLGIEPIGHIIASNEWGNYKRLKTPEPLYEMSKDYPRLEKLLLKQLAAARILNTNHSATEVRQLDNGVTLARGIMIHVPDGRSNDHVPTPLGDGDKWYVCVKNRCPVR